MNETLFYATSALDKSLDIITSEAQNLDLQHTEYWTIVQVHTYTHFNPFSFWNLRLGTFNKAQLW